MKVKVFGLFMLFTVFAGLVAGPNPFVSRGTAPVVVNTDSKFGPLPPPPVEGNCSWLWGPPCIVKK